MKFKIVANENFDIENIAKEVIELKKENPDWNLEDCVSDAFQEHFMDLDMDDVVDIYKDIVDHQDGIYEQISDAVYNYLSDKIIKIVKRNIKNK